MKLAESYDFICTGGGIASYLCAALLSKSGQKVLLIDDQDSAFYSKNNHPLFTADLTAFSGLKPGQLFSQILNELKIDIKNFKTEDVFLQVLTPAYNIAFNKSMNDVALEFKRKLPPERLQPEHLWCFFEKIYKAGNEIPSFVNDVPKLIHASFSDIKTWKNFWGKQLKAMRSSTPVAYSELLPPVVAPECERLCKIILSALTYICPHNINVEQALRGLSLIFQGQSFSHDGFQKLREELIEIIKVHGDVKLETRVESLVVEGKKITGVLLSSYEGIIQSNFIILGGSLKRLYYTLPQNILDQTVLRSLNRLVPTHWRFTFLVKVFKKILPDGVTPYMTYVHSYEDPLEEENFLQIQILDSYLRITALVPYKASTLEYDYLQKLAGRMMHLLCKVFPYLDENILEIHPDFRKGTEEIKKYYPFQGLNWLPERLIHYYVRGRKNIQDFWGVPFFTPHKNLYFVGHVLWPSLGVYGEALSALRVFEEVMYGWTLTQKEKIL